MKALLSNCLFIVTMLVGTFGSPLRHVAQTKELKSNGGKRTPVLCWVVQVHSKLQCHPTHSIVNHENFQTLRDDAEHAQQGDVESTSLRSKDESDRSNDPTCKLLHYNGIAKELGLSVIHIFSKFSNHILMCYVEDHSIERTLSRIDQLHQELLKPENSNEFMYHKRTIENRLNSHLEVVSFHAEHTHQHKPRTNVPNDISTKKFDEGEHLPTVLMEKNMVLSEKCFWKILQEISNSSNHINDSCGGCKNRKKMFTSVKINSSLVKFCNEITTFSPNNMNLTADKCKYFIKAMHILSCCHNFPSLQTLECANDSSSQSVNCISECLKAVIKPVIHYVCNETIAHLSSLCNSSLKCVTTRKGDMLKFCFRSWYVHLKEILIPILDNTLNQSTSSSILKPVLYRLCKRTIMLLLDHVFPESFPQKIMIKNDICNIFKTMSVIPSSPLQWTPMHHHLKPKDRRLLRSTLQSSTSSLKSYKSSSLSLSDESRKRRSPPIRPSTPTVSFNDPAYPRQWHLHNVATPSMDVDVISLWVKGYNGSGVTVAVVDDGLQWQNEDLKTNYEYRGSWDFNDDDPDPSPSTKKTANHHGTRCAGEIAAVANNSLCGVGVAYGAKISGIRVLDGVMTDSLEAEAFNKAMDINDVYSCSWGPDDDGMTVDGPHLMAARAMRHGIEFGRHGYGSIFVVASGNGGLHKDNCNFDGYANSIYTMTIGAVDESGSMPYYAEECASMLGVTFSSGTTNKRDIVTTDWTYHNPSGCTEKHTGTSAAAPLAAGLIALMLQARPCLTWRDVQYIIILTAKKVDVDIAHWQKNGAGLSHSHKHGFGLLSSWRMVNAASVWQLVPWMTSYSRTNDLNGNHLYIPKGGNAVGKKGHGQSQLSLVVGVEVREQDVHGYSLFTVESVQVTVWLSHPCRGKLSIKVTSPSRTVSVIAAPRPKDNSSSGFDDWTFTTVRCWGESPIGNWTLIISDTDNDEYGQGKLTKWRLTLFGTPMSRSEFNERRSLVESAMDGHYLSANRSLQCPPPPHKAEVVEPLSEKTLKIVILCGVFFVVMAVYETFEYMCCYNDEKKEYQQEVEQMQLARRMTERTLRAIHHEYQSAVVPNITEWSTTRPGVGRTINDLNALSPMSSIRLQNLRRNRDAGEGSNSNGSVSRGNVSRNFGVVDDGDSARNDDNNYDDDEEDLFDAAETSGLLRRSIMDNDENENNSSEIHHQSSSSSYKSRTPPQRSQSKISLFTQSVRMKMAHLSSVLGKSDRHQRHDNAINDDNNVESYKDDTLGRHDNMGLIHNENVDDGDSDEQEDEIFNSSLRRN